MSSQTIERVAPPLAARFPGKYVSLVSFKRDGTPVATPLWFVADGTACWPSRTRSRRRSSGSAAIRR